MDEQKRTELDQLGEFELINRLTKKFKSKNNSSIYGVGDDAAVINSTDKAILASTDTLIEGFALTLLMFH